MVRKAWRDFSVVRAWQAEGDGLPPLSVQQSVRGKVQSGPARGRRGIKAQVDKPGASDCL